MCVALFASSSSRGSERAREREDGCKSVSLKQLKLRGWERACGEVEFAVWQGNN